MPSAPLTAWTVEDLPTTEERAFDAAAFHAVLLAASPLTAALERPLPFTMNNANSGLKLGQSYGALLVCLQVTPE
jgi:Holliday junction resolvasome RuvABC endonuclease subunit